MAMRDLMHGDCERPNSLMRLTSHFIKDHGYKEEGIYQPFASEGPAEIVNSDQLVQQFLEESSHPQTFKMSNLLQEMQNIDRSMNPTALPHPVGPAMPGTSQQESIWANQFLQQGPPIDDTRLNDIWGTQVTEVGNPTLGNPTVGNRNPQALFPTSEIAGLNYDSAWTEEYIKNIIKDTKQVNETSAADNHPVSSKFIKFMQREDNVPIEANESKASHINVISEQWADEAGKQEVSMNDVWKQSDGTQNAVEEELEAAGTWVNEFTEEKKNDGGAEFNESSFWDRLQKEWDKLSPETSSASHSWISEYETYYDPFKEYSFNKENPMANLNDALEEGKRRLEQGDLPGAVLCFEAAVQKEPENPEIWLLLGKTQAENEQDPLAISALKKCLTLEPSNQDALMALAVSYTNESFQNQACITLKEWLLKNEKYSHMVDSKPSGETAGASAVSTLLFDTVYKEVKELYIRAARMNPRNEIDPDVQCGLGILFNLSCEYEKAADCFQAALSVRPDDSRLWNKLGATLANGQRSEEAVNAYHRALNLSPGFIRARYNLGISCINLGAYREAGEHLLTALNQQAAGQKEFGKATRAMSDAIWSTLRLVVSLMHKYHLNDSIENRDLTKLNAEFNIE